MKTSHSSWTYIFIAHMKRDFLTNSRSLIDLISIIGFMLLIPFTRKIIFKATLRKKNNDNKNKKDDVIDGEIVDKKDEL